jgi:hypothetical protein
MSLFLESRIERALSIRQPHVEAILEGIKIIEFRSQYTHIRERVWLYAPKKIDNVDVDKVYPDLRHRFYVFGKIVGSVEIIHCVKCGDGFHWHLSTPIRYEQPLSVVNHPQPVFWYPKFKE